MTVARVNFTHTETEVNWQTTDPNAGIFCGSLRIHALNNIEFLNGIPAKILGKADLEAKHVILQGGVLHSSSHTNREGISIGVTASGHPTVGASVSASNASATSYVNQEIDAEIVNINAKTLDIDSGNINAVEIGGTVETVNITSHCDTSESESKGLSGDSEGNFNYQQSSSHTKVINKVSGINATNSTLKIGEGNLTGGRLTVTGNNQIKVEHLNTSSVEEEKQGSSLSLCGNPQDLGGTGNRSFASAIPTIGVNVGKGDYRAHQDSIFTGAAEQSGLDSSGGDGLHETHNTQFQQKVEIPLFNQEGSRQLEDDLIRLEAQFSTPSVPANPVPVESPKEPVVHHTKAHADTEHKQSAGEESPQAKTPSATASRRSVDHSKERVIADAEKTLAEVDKITHESLTSPHTGSPVSTGLAHYGMWGERAAPIQDMRARTEGTQMKTRSDAGEETPTFLGGIQEELFNAYRSPAKLSETFLDRASSIAKEKSIRSQEAEQRFSAGVEIKNELSSGGFKQWEQDVEQGLKNDAGKLSKWSMFAKGGAVSLGVGQGVVKVVEAKPEERPKEAVLASAEIVGESLGSRGCERALAKVALELAPESMGVSLILIPAAMVGCGAAGGYIAEHLVKDELDKSSAQTTNSLTLGRG